MANMSDAAKIEMREYYKKYREKNKDKIRERNREYWEKRAAKRKLNAQPE